MRLDSIIRKDEDTSMSPDLYRVVKIYSNPTLVLEDINGKQTILPIDECQQVEVTDEVRYWKERSFNTRPNKPDTPVPKGYKPSFDVPDIVKRNKGHK